MIEKNPNHPVKGSSTTVEPIRKPEHIEAILKLLEGNPRDSLLFVMAINNGLRCGDLLKIKVGDVMHLRVGGFTIIKEGKTGKKNYVWINEAVYAALQEYLSFYKPHSSDFLFPSQKGGQPLTIMAVNNMVKKWGIAVGIKDNLGAHSLRKTWGYAQRMYYHTPVELITKRYNHSDPRVTMAYLGIEDEEVRALGNNVIPFRRKENEAQ
jgi:integrase